jgi:hypothetical protein
VFNLFEIVREQIHDLVTGAAKLNCFHRAPIGYFTFHRIKNTPFLVVKSSRREMAIASRRASLGLPGNLGNSRPAQVVS